MVRQSGVCHQTAYALSVLALSSRFDGPTAMVIESWS